MFEEQNAEQYVLYLDMGDVLDQDQLDGLTRQLQREIRDQVVEAADILTSDKIPEGTKAAGAITWGAIAIEVLPTFLPGVIEFLKSWVNREESRNVKIQTHVGDKSINLEYSSTGIKENEVKELLAMLTTSMQEASTETEEEPALEEAPDQPEPQAKDEQPEPEVGDSQPVEEKAEEMLEENPADEPEDSPTAEISEEPDEEK